MAVCRLDSRLVRLEDRDITLTRKEYDVLAALARHPGAFSSWGRSLVPQDIDVEDFASAFVRFDNGATLILEVSWLLHHNTAGEEAKIWLYGTEGGCEWPAATFLSSNYTTRQLLNTTLQTIQDTMEPHALECVEFAKAVADGVVVTPEAAADPSRVTPSVARTAT